VIDLDDFDALGFASIEAAVAGAALDQYRDAVAHVSVDGARGGVRGVLGGAAPDLVAATRRLVGAFPLARALESVASTRAHIVRAILFDKTRVANWRVPWHQDLFVAVDDVAVEARAAARGFGAWTMKAGVLHARAPRGVLERMLAVRIHIDDCGDDNAPLRVLAGTHGRGVLDDADIAALARDIPATTCLARAGDVLVLRPLLLHASSPARAPGHRRVLHLEITDVDLPAPLAWHERHPLT
jgi:hypothetical protein